MGYYLEASLSFTLRDKKQFHVPFDKLLYYSATIIQTFFLTIFEILLTLAVHVS